MYRFNLGNKENTIMGNVIKHCYRGSSNIDSPVNAVIIFCKLAIFGVCACNKKKKKLNQFIVPFSR